MCIGTQNTSIAYITEAVSGTTYTSAGERNNASVYRHEHTIKVATDDGTANKGEKLVTPCLMFVAFSSNTSSGVFHILSSVRAVLITSPKRVLLHVDPLIMLKLWARIILTGLEITPS